MLSFSKSLKVLFRHPQGLNVTNSFSTFDAMKDVSILIPGGDYVVSSVVGPFKIFNKVNDLLGEPYYRVNLVGMDSDHHVYGGLFNVNHTHTTEEKNNTDLVVIPAILGDIPSALVKK